MRSPIPRLAPSVLAFLLLAAASHAEPGLLGQGTTTIERTSTPDGTAELPHIEGQVPVQERLVLVVSIDGLRPDAWGEAETPTLDLLARDGAHTKVARSAELPKTLPGHTSMLTGVQPSVHGITQNRWRPWDRKVAQPTVFRWVRSAGLDTTMIVTKRKFRLLDVRGGAETFIWERDRAWRILWKPELKGNSSQVVDAALGELEKGRRGLYFLHLPEVDDRGHKKGWMSPEQIAAVAEVDRQLTRLRAGVQELGLLPATTWLITADHGGHGKDHGDDIPEDRLVPFILSGRGVKPGASLGADVQILDVAPTAAALFEVAPPPGLEGQAVAAALVDPPPAPRPSANDLPSRNVVSRAADAVFDRIPPLRIGNWNPF